MIESPVFGLHKGYIPDIPLEAQLDRYECHAKHCSSCQSALKRAQLAKKLAPFVAIAVAAVARPVWLKACGILLGAGIDNVSERVIKAILGPRRGDLHSAAQFANKDK